MESEQSRRREKKEAESEKEPEGEKAAKKEATEWKTNREKRNHFTKAKK
jgi:hypothetical protein